MFAVRLFALVSHKGLRLDGRGPPVPQRHSLGSLQVASKEKRPSINRETLKDPPNETKNGGGPRPRENAGALQKLFARLSPLKAERLLAHFGRRQRKQNKKAHTERGGV